MVDALVRASIVLRTAVLSFLAAALGLIITSLMLEAPPRSPMIISMLAVGIISAVAYIWGLGSVSNRGGICSKQFFIWGLASMLGLAVIVMVMFFAEGEVLGSINDLIPNEEYFITTGRWVYIALVGGELFSIIFSVWFKHITSEDDPGSRAKAVRRLDDLTKDIEMNKKEAKDKSYDELQKRMHQKYGAHMHTNPAFSEESA